MNTAAQTPASIRAELAARRILRWKFAVRLGIHPCRLSAILNERLPLTPEMAARIAKALDQTDAPRGR